ncbi:MAG: hypothetical protein MHM6MM_005183 [Cercozoa sp. M6MM]
MHVQCVTFETPRRDSYLSQKAFNFDVLQSEGTSVDTWVDTWVDMWVDTCLSVHVRVGVWGADSATVATGLDAALIQINATREILEALQRHLTQRSVRNRALSEVLQSSARIHWHDKKLWRPRSLLDACVVLPLQVTFLLLRCVFGVMLSGLNLPLWNTPSGVRRVKHLSTVLQQIERRLVHVCRWPLLLSRYRQPQKNGAVAAAAFVSFFSSVTQVWVDVLVGWLCGIVMMRHASLVLETTHVFGQVLHIDVLRSHTEWLMGLPAGMKLNAPLNHFLGSLALHVFDMWNTVTTFVTPLEPMLLAALGIVGAFGASFVLAAIVDGIDMFTSHVRLLHSALAAVYRGQLAALASLWRLFRGKKKNELRDRVDSLSPAADQLMLGTVMFAVLFLLLPTVAIHYFFFCIVRLLTSSAQALVGLLLFTLNSFPFFGLLVHATRAHTLPGGVQITVLDFDEPQQSNTSYYRMCNKPVGSGPLFAHFRADVRHVFRHFRLSAVLRSVAFGKPYPRLPESLVTRESDETVPTLDEFWLLLRHPSCDRQRVQELTCDHADHGTAHPHSD